MPHIRGTLRLFTTDVPMPQSSSHEGLLFDAGATVPLVLLEARD